MIYKYSLDKGSKKFICPQCQKRTFVRYRDNESGDLLEQTYGRCDRESKCRYHNRPQGNGNIHIPRGYHEPVKEIDCLHEDVLHHFINGSGFFDNHFLFSLAHIFSPQELLQAQRRFFIGICNHWQGDTIFWQVDDKFQVRTGKVMLYDRDTGKRVKNPRPLINWMHRILGMKVFNLEQCLFGLHQVLDLKGDEVINIVESEKTAVILSILKPECVWMATGSKTGFKERMLRPLKGYRIIAFPDKSEWSSWDKTAGNLNNMGFEIECNELLENSDLEDGSDLADYLLGDIHY